MVEIVLLGLVDLKLIGTWGWLVLLPFLSGILDIAQCMAFLKLTRTKVHVVLQVSEFLSSVLQVIVNRGINWRVQNNAINRQTLQIEASITKL